MDRTAQDTAPTDQETRRRAAAERKRRQRMREALGLQAMTIGVDRAAVVLWLLDAGRLREDEARDDSRITEELEQVIREATRPNVTL